VRGIIAADDPKQTIAITGKECDMKFKSLGIFTLGAISAIAFSALAQQANPRQDVAQFRIELEVLRADNGVRMQCTEGCAWQTLSFSCDSQRGDCQSSIDQYGTPAN
jgi:hypothetical protein